MFYGQLSGETAISLFDFNFFAMKPVVSILASWGGKKTAKVLLKWPDGCSEYSLSKMHE